MDQLFTSLKTDFINGDFTFNIYLLMEHFLNGRVPLRFVYLDAQYINVKLKCNELKS